MTKGNRISNSGKKAASPRIDRQLALSPATIRTLSLHDDDALLWTFVFYYEERPPRNAMSRSQALVTMPLKPKRGFATRVPKPHVRRLWFEPLEDRRLLSITVSTLVDESDGSIVDGDISLRDAIVAAPVGETIDFSVIGTINLSSLGQLTINKNLTIHGPSAGLLTIRAFPGTAAAGDGADLQCG